jgi:8-oxo-dGTP pyrophosphatase MutT (NUDIX family)
MQEHPIENGSAQARRAARVILADSADRILLFRGFDPAEPRERYWFTPGGGLEPGEPSAQGAVRELFEETGLRLNPADLGGPIHRDVTVFSFNGMTYRQEQEFYLARVGTWEVDTAGFDVWERDTIDKHRWWSLAELSVTREVYYPGDLVELTRRALAAC